MEFLQNLNIYALVILTLVLASSLAFAMGAFSSKNHMPVEGRVRIFLPYLSDTD